MASESSKGGVQTARIEQVNRNLDLERAAQGLRAAERAARAAEETAQATKWSARWMAVSGVAALSIVILSSIQLWQVRVQTARAERALADATVAQEELREVEERLTLLTDGMAKIAYLYARPVSPGFVAASESEQEVELVADELLELVYPVEADRQRLLEEVEEIRREGRRRRGLD